MLLLGAGDLLLTVLLVLAVLVLGVSSCMSLSGEEHMELLKLTWLLYSLVLDTLPLSASSSSLCWESVPESAFFLLLLFLLPLLLVPSPLGRGSRILVKLADLLPAEVSVSFKMGCTKSSEDESECESSVRSDMVLRVKTSSVLMLLALESFLPTRISAQIL